MAAPVVTFCDFYATYNVTVLAFTAAVLVFACFFRGGFLNTVKRSFERFSLSFYDILTIWNQVDKGHNKIKTTVTWSTLYPHSFPHRLRCKNIGKIHTEPILSIVQKMMPLSLWQAMDRAFKSQKMPPNGHIMTHIWSCGWKDMLEKWLLIEITSW